MKSAILLTAALFAAPAVAAGVNDAEIFHILHTANTGEIAAAKVAQSKAAAKNVKAFADAMVADHNDLDLGGDKLAKKLKVTPKDNDTSRALKSDADKELADLRSASGSAFDKAYIDAQVKDHQTVLAAIDDTLMPSVKDPELKDMLTSARPKIQMHLDHAKAIQSELAAH